MSAGYKSWGVNILKAFVFFSAVGWCVTAYSQQEKQSGKDELPPAVQIAQRASAQIVYSGKKEYAHSGFFIDSKTFITAGDWLALSLMNNPYSRSSVYIEQNGKKIQIKSIKNISFSFGLASLEVENYRGPALMLDDDKYEQGGDYFLVSLSSASAQKLNGSVIVNEGENHYGFFSSDDSKNFSSELFGAPIIDRLGRIAAVVSSGSPSYILGIKETVLKEFISQGVVFFEASRTRRHFTEGAELNFMKPDVFFKNHIEASLYHLSGRRIAEFLESEMLALKNKAENKNESAVLRLAWLYSMKNQIPVSFIDNIFQRFVFKRRYSPATVFLLTQRAAKLGQRTAQFNLAMMYLQGLYTEPNRQLTLKWAAMSADKGYPLAEYFLGMVYLLGLDDHRAFLNIPKAFYWLKKAKEHGHPEAGKVLSAMSKLEQTGGSTVSLSRYMSLLPSLQEILGVNQSLDGSPAVSASDCSRRF